MSVVFCSCTICSEWKYHFHRWMTCISSTMTFLLVVLFITKMVYCISIIIYAFKSFFWYLSFVIIIILLKSCFYWLPVFNMFSRLISFLVFVLIIYVSNGDSGMVWNVDLGLSHWHLGLLRRAESFWSRISKVIRRWWCAPGM